MDGAVGHLVSPDSTSSRSIASPEAISVAGNSVPSSEGRFCCRALAAHLESPAQLLSDYLSFGQEKASPIIDEQASYSNEN